MGRTLPSNAVILMKEREKLKPFRNALKPSDRIVFDELFRFAQLHTAEAGYANHVLPLEIFLLAMLLEQHKEVMRLRDITGERESSKND